MAASGHISERAEGVRCGFPRRHCCGDVGSRGLGSRSFSPLVVLGWSGAAVLYRSKPEFKLYLKTKGLSYSTWMKRNPGVAPWEPGATVRSAPGKSWDWKRDMLLSINAALLATVAAVLLGRTTLQRRQRGERALTVRAGEGRDPPISAATRACANALGYVKSGVGELTQLATSRAREHPRAYEELGLYAFVAALTAACGLLVLQLLG